jgi:DNA-binding GntR family transcriptional regulator
MILNISGGTELVEFVRQVVKLPFVFFGPSTTAISAHYHRQITTALANRDGERAEMIMKEHILEARDVSVNHVLQLQAHEELQNVDGSPLVIQSDRFQA